MWRAILLSAALLSAGAGAPAAFGGDDPRSSDPNAPVHAGTETVEVTADAGVAEGAPSGFTTVIRAEEFQGRFVTLADLLDEAVGVRVRSFGGLDSFATVAIRGSTAEQVVVFVDGVPLNSALGGGVNLADIPLAGVEAIEIHRSFAPASLGASSIGGAVNVRTRGPAGGDAASASISYGSHSTGSMTALADWTAGRIRWAASSEAATTGGDFTYLDDNATSFTTADDRERLRPNNASWRAALRVRGEADLAPGRSLTLSAEWGRRRQGVPGIAAAPSEHASADFLRGLLLAGMSWRDLCAGRCALEARLDHEYTSSEFDNSDDPRAATFQDTVTRTSGAGASLRLIRRAGARNRISFLVEPRAQSAESIDRLRPGSDPIRASRSSLALVAEDEIHLVSGRLLLAPSLRWDGVRDRSRGGAPGAPSGPRDDPSAVSGRLGGFLALSPRLDLRASVGRSHRVPSLIDLYGNDGTIAGNPGLRPETGVTADAGIALHDARAGRARGVALEVVAFRTDTEDLIQLEPTAARTLKPFNVGRARVTGIEASLALRLFGRLTASANCTRQRPVNLSDGPAMGTDLYGRPRLTADTSLSLALGPGALFHRFSYVGENDFVRAGSLPSSRVPLTRLPARYLHDAGVRWRFAGRLEGSLEVLNLLDRRVVDIARYPLPGRMIVGRISAAF